MKAYLITKYNSDLILEDVPDPVCGDSDVIVKTKNLGICGTDLKILSGKLDGIVNLPHIPCHEIAGEICEIGKNVKNINVGDKGIVYFYLGCKDCEMCRTNRENICQNITRFGFERNGGFSEYIKVPVYNFCKVDESKLTLPEMAVLPDAVLTPYHAIKCMGELKVGEKMLVVGIGGLGMHAIQIGKMMGAQVAGTTRQDNSIELARNFGLDLAINSARDDVVKKIMEWTDGKGVDLVLEGVGIPETLEWSLKCLKRGGRLVFMGYDPSKPITLNTLYVHYNELQIKGTRLGTKQELLEVINYAEQGLIKPVITKILDIKNINEGYKMLSERKESGRIVFNSFN